MTSSYGNDGWGNYNDPKENEDLGVFVDMLGVTHRPTDDDYEDAVFALYMWMLVMNDELVLGWGSTAEDSNEDWVFGLPGEWK